VNSSSQDLEENWHNADGTQCDFSEVVEQLKKYVDLGGVIYVGSDSMLGSLSCTFAITICMHMNHGEVANYYFKKFKADKHHYVDLRTKITEEINIAINTALNIKEKFPNAHIEVHADVGKTKRSRTREFVDFIRGWVTGVGFVCKIKPESWASSIADWHTK